MVDKDTLFSTVVILSEREPTKSVWDAYVHSWFNLYAGYSIEIHDDQGPQFQSTECNFLLQAAGIRKTDSGIESHNALGVGEIYHDFLKFIYKKAHAENPTIPKKQVLSLAVNAMNNAAGHNGLSPALLVFGIVPRNPLKPTTLPAMNQRFIVMQKALR